MDQDSASMHAGPSRPTKIPPKPKSPHPSTSTYTSNAKRRKLQAPLPPRPTSSAHPTTSTLNGVHSTLPKKVLQGTKTRRTDTTHPGFGREEIFVTRKISLGALMGRCRSLVVDEGYSRLTLHAMTAAIPHALLLLYALLDLLPYPKGPKGMWYEIHTGSVECVDEIERAVKGKRVSGEGDGEEEEDDDEMFKGIGGIEEDEPERNKRLQSSIRIDLHISPRPKPKIPQAKDMMNTAKVTPTQTAKKAKKNRPSKRQRQALVQKRKEEERRTNMTGQIDEEEMMNIDTAGHLKMLLR